MVVKNLKLIKSNIILFEIFMLNYTFKKFNTKILWLKIIIWYISLNYHLFCITMNLSPDKSRIFFWYFIFWYVGFYTHNYFQVEPISEPSLPSDTKETKTKTVEIPPINQVPWMFICLKQLSYINCILILNSILQCSTYISL